MDSFQGYGVKRTHQYLNGALPFRREVLTGYLVALLPVAPE